MSENESVQSSLKDDEKTDVVTDEEKAEIEKIEREFIKEMTKTVRVIQATQKLVGCMEAIQKARKDELDALDSLLGDE